LVIEFFLIFYLINPDTFVPVFAAIIVATVEEDEYKWTKQKDSSLDQKKESNCSGELHPIISMDVKEER
jgi:hypothetical protein